MNSLRTVIAIGFLRIHTALTRLLIAITLLEAIHNHTVNKETGQSEDSIQSLAPGFYKYVRVKGRNLQCSRSLHSACKVPTVS